MTAPPTNTATNDNYCSLFDLTTTMPLRASDHSRIHFIDVDTIDVSLALKGDIYQALYAKLDTLITEKGYACAHFAFVFDRY